jgi:antirestriction protein
MVYEVIFPITVNELYNWEYNDMVDFIDSYGEDDFINHYETYHRLVDDYGQGVVDEFMEDYDIENFEDMYQGQYESGADFAEQICQDCGYISNNTPHWIVIDWERTWEANLRHDYIFALRSQHHSHIDLDTCLQNSQYRNLP